MNKIELIHAAAEAAQISKKDVAVVVNAVFDTIAQTLAARFRHLSLEKR